MIHEVTAFTRLERFSRGQSSELLRMYLSSAIWLKEKGVFKAFEDAAGKLKDVRVIGFPDKGRPNIDPFFLFRDGSESLSTVSLVGQDYVTTTNSSSRIGDTSEWANFHNFKCNLVQAVVRVDANGGNRIVIVKSGVREFHVAFHADSENFLPELSRSYDNFAPPDFMEIPETELAEKLAPTLEKFVKKAGFTSLDK